MYPQPVPTTGQVGVRPPIYPHLATGVLPPNLQQQLIFQQMQDCGQMQQPAPAYGGVPRQPINLQLQKPTMQMQPLPVQQPYTRKPRGRNAIRIINPDTGNEVKVDSGSSEAPQVPTPPVTVTPALMTSSVSVSSTESSFSSTRSGATEEFRRKVAQAANSELRPPPLPNAIIRDPNNPKQMAETRQELTSSDTQPVQPVAEESSKLLPPESEKTNLEPPSGATLTAPVHTPTPTPTPTPTSTLTPAPTLTPTHMDILVGGGPGNLDETGIVVSQEEKQPPLSETIDSVKDESSRPSEALQPDREGEGAQMQGKVEEEEKTKCAKETKLSEESKEMVADSILVTTGPSPLVPEAVESATEEKSTQEVEVERPIQPVQQERPVSIPAEADLQPPHPHSENILEPSEPSNSANLPEFTSGPPPMLSTEQHPVTGTKPDIPPTTEDKRSSSEPVTTVVASRTETLTDKTGTSEAADSGVQNVEEINGQEIQPHSEVVVPPKPSRQDIEEQSSHTSLPGSSRTEVTVENQSSQPGEDADNVGRTFLPEEQAEEDRAEVVVLAQTDYKLRMKALLPVVEGLHGITVTPETARAFVTNLGFNAEEFQSLPGDLPSICHLWMDRRSICYVEELTVALVYTRGLGRFTTQLCDHRNSRIQVF